MRKLSSQTSENVKVAVIGLDSAAPQLVFYQYREELPNLARLMGKGLWGELESTIPPITVPAWLSMVTSLDPGQLGLYGFRNRRSYNYNDHVIANSNMVEADTVWDVLGRAGKRVILLGVPPSYPPKPVNGVLTTCFLTPSTKSQYTYPPELRKEVEKVVGEYKIDVENFRTEDKEKLLEEIYELAEQRFTLAKHFLTTKPWDFFMMVEMGVDRIQHGFWKFTDPNHPKHTPGNKYLNVIKDYYKYLDKKIGELLDLLPEETNIVVVSDHGAQPMKGGICINEWLVQRGYLTLENYPPRLTPIEKLSIDWGHTKAWGSGGYYARIFINVKKREPNGVIEKKEYEEFREKLKHEIEEIPDEDGGGMENKVYKPEEVYQSIRGIPPDLIVYFDNLRWRSVGSLGLNTLHTHENDTGPDDANHSQQGIFILCSPENRLPRGHLYGLNILDVAPTLLDFYGLSLPHPAGGESILNQAKPDKP